MCIKRDKEREGRLNDMPSWQTVGPNRQPEERSSREAGGEGGQLAIVTAHLCVKVCVYKGVCVCVVCVCVACV